MRVALLYLISSLALGVSLAYAGSNCQGLSPAECYTKHLDSCILDKGPEGYFCREPRPPCEEKWRQMGKNLRQSCEETPGCRFEDAYCFCECNFEGDCECDCAGGNPVRCIQIQDDSVKEEHSQIISKTVDDPYQIETLRFKITGLHNKPVLILPDGKRIKIPRVWLYPAKEKEVEEDQGAYVSSFKYLEDVTSFLIDKELLGLHIDSWDSMTSGHGSASAGAGRDIFLVYNSKTNRIYPGVIDLGITKDRVRSMGCFFATFHNFVLGDVNDDGLTDIGVKLEKIWCEEGYDEKKQVDTISAPYYKEYPIEWYVFRENRWEKAPQFNGVQPKMAIQKMPMIGLSKSPVDFVREIYKEELKVKK